MGRILLLLAGAAILALPAAAAAGSQTRAATPGFLVVHNGSTDAGVLGKPVATVAVQGFVLGHIKQEGAVQIYHLSGAGFAAQVAGADLSRRAVTYRSRGVSVPGTEYSGSDFRFRAVGGVWRIVVYGAGVSLYVGGVARRVSLHGSVAYPRADGRYSIDGGRYRSLPTGVVTLRLGHR
jgi:hypothetical protein